MHSMLFFWHRYELPAVANGRVSLSQPRMTMMMGLASPAPPAANTIPSLVTEPPHHHHPHSTFAAAADEVGEEEEDGSGGGGAEPRRLWANAGARQQQQRGVPMVGLSARRSRVEFDDSYNDPSQQQHPHQTPGSLSRPESSVGLFQEDDSSSYLYYMDGEVVVHRAQHRPPPPPPTAPTSNHQQPLRSFPAPHSPASFSTISAGDRLHQQHLELLSDPSTYFVLLELFVWSLVHNVCCVSRIIGTQFNVSLGVSFCSVPEWYSGAHCNAQRRGTVPGGGPLCPRERRRRSARNQRSACHLASPRH